MSRVLKWVAVLLVGLVLLAIVAAVLLPKVIDPNDYRDDISKLVYDQTGLTLKIKGPVAWSLFPWVGLSFEQLSVAGTDGNPLAKLGSAEVSVKLLPLLSKKLEIETARLAGLDLELVRNENGRGNWEVSSSQSKQANNAPNQQVTGTESMPGNRQNKPLELDIASIEVSRFKLNYDDRVTGNFYTIDQASITTGAIANQKPFNISVDAIVSSKAPDLTLRSTLTATLTFNLKDGLYELKNLTAAVQPNVNAGEKLSLKGNIRFQQDPMMVQGNLDFNEFNPRNLLSQISTPLPPMGSEKSLESLSFASQFKSNGKRLDVNKLNLTVDDFTVDGFVNITDLQKQSINFELTGNDLNLDNYMPVSASSSEPSKEGQSPETKPQAPAAQEQPLIPEGVLKSLNLNGSLSLASLTASKLKFVQPSIKINANNGVSQVKLNSGFYEGTIKLNGQVDVNTSGAPKLNSDASLKGINLQSMADPVPALKSVQGSVNADMKIKTHGQLQSTLTRNLNGTVSFGIDRGSFTEANFNKMVCEGIARIRNKKLQDKEWNKTTEFQYLSGTFIIRNGIATNKDLTAALSSFNLKGDGKVNLVEQTLDYHVGLNIRGEEALDSDPACQINKDYVDVTWPVRCQGKLGQQQCGIDTQRLAGTVRGLAKKEAQKRIQKEIDKNIEGPLKDALKGLFK